MPRPPKVVVGAEPPGQPTIKIAGHSLELHEVELDLLQDSDYNPRKLSLKEERELKNSLETFGFIDPVIINVNPDRFNILVGGHKRVAALRDLKYTHVKCIQVNLSLEQERELNLRLNRGGEWDFDKLAQFFDPQELDFVGFKMEEITTAFPTFGKETGKVKAGTKNASKGADPDKPTSLPFSMEVDKTADYLFVVVRDAEIMDSLTAALGLEKVQDMGKRHKGIQHIISGEHLLKAISKA